MKTAEQEIADLDAAILMRWTPVTFRREGADEPLLADKLAFVRRNDPKLLAAGYSQNARSVIVSVTGLDAWEPLPGERDLIRIGDGAFAVIESAEIIEFMGVPVRINIIVMDAS